MGVDVLVFVKKEDLKKMFRDYPCLFVLSLLDEMWGVRWHRFCQKWGFDDSVDLITSVDMLKNLALGKAKVEDKEFWVEFLMKYRLIAIPDCLDSSVVEEIAPEILTKDYVCVNDLLCRIIDLIEENLDEMIDNLNEAPKRGQISNNNIRR